ncbi:unnamed protein product [Didymodactylos carnosus]|uniref:Uncharacterized protein n=1 Tax=Didymodactylos carnosus TaxID=1234261 RepID=A0A8S2RV95_9BILA|nr:unnamed protein product [Didymodactylos carnosus]CAF4190942.1 unnamed protein product [Didymodactylos carnosus]
MCIDKALAFDESVDCLDASDETTNPNCLPYRHIECDEYNSAWMRFYLGNYLTSNSPLNIFSTRDSFPNDRTQLYTENMYRFERNDENVSIQCWQYMICRLKIRIYNLNADVCLGLCVDDENCVNAIKRSCPDTPYMFPLKTVM